MWISYDYYLQRYFVLADNRRTNSIMALAAGRTQDQAMFHGRQMEERG